jgi:hypothetical protein
LDGEGLRPDDLDLAEALLHSLSARLLPDDD